MNVLPIRNQMVLSYFSLSSPLIIVKIKQDSEESFQLIKYLSLKFKYLVVNNYKIISLSQVQIPGCQQL